MFHYANTVVTFLHFNFLRNNGSVWQVLFSKQKRMSLFFEKSFTAWGLNSAVCLDLLLLSYPFKRFFCNKTFLCIHFLHVNKLVSSGVLMPEIMSRRLFLLFLGPNLTFLQLRSEVSDVRTLILVSIQHWSASHFGHFFSDEKCLTDVTK